MAGKVEIVISEVIEMLENGKTRKDIGEKYDLTQNDVKELFTYPALKGRKTKKVKEKPFIIIDDVTPSAEAPVENKPNTETPRAEEKAEETPEADKVEAVAPSAEDKTEPPKRKRRASKKAEKKEGDAAPKEDLTAKKESPKEETPWGKLEGPWANQESSEQAPEEAETITLDTEQPIYPPVSGMEDTLTPAEVEEKPKNDTPPSPWGKVTI